MESLQTIPVGVVYVMRRVNRVKVTIGAEQFGVAD